METVKVTSGGQVIIPANILKKLDLNEGGNITFVEDGDKIVLAKFRC